MQRAMFALLITAVILTMVGCSKEQKIQPMPKPAIERLVRIEPGGVEKVCYIDRRHPYQVFTYCGATANSDLSWVEIQTKENPERQIMKYYIWQSRESAELENARLIRDEFYTGLAVYWRESAEGQALNDRYSKVRAEYIRVNPEAAAFQENQAKQ